MLQKFNPANKDIVVNINGKLIHRDQAGISPFDSSVQGGDAVWEGLRLYQGFGFNAVGTVAQHLGKPMLAPAGRYLKEEYPNYSNTLPPDPMAIQIGVSASLSLMSQA